MAKAILVMNMPKACYECPLKVLLNAYSSYRCIKTKEIIESTSIKPTWCPLREVPQKMEPYGMSDGIAIGYNACIEEILGGGE